MKKLTTWFAMATLLFAFNSTFLTAENTIDPASMDLAKTELTMKTSAETSQAILSVPEAEMAMVNSVEAVETAYANALLDRLNEIKEMDMSSMSSSEKNELRKEVRAIEKEQRPSGGVYISIGGAILIILLLILLL